MHKDFEKKVEAFLKEQNLIAPEDRVLVGLSGGADSVCLLTVLHTLTKKLSFSMGAFHAVCPCQPRHPWGRGGPG